MTVGGVTRNIVQDLGVRIVTGQFEKTPFPSESMLCEQYGAARTVTREAVKMLTAKGLITSRPRQGITIAPEDNWNLFDPDVMRWLLERKFSLQLLIEFIQIRLVLEPGAAAIAAKAATAEDKAAISHAIKRMYAAEDGQDDALASDIAFHVAVLHASHNRFFKQLRDMIATALQISITRTNEMSGVAVGSARDHEQVAKYILAGDSDRAAKSMRKLIAGTLELIEGASG